MTNVTDDRNALWSLLAEAYKVGLLKSDDRAAEASAIERYLGHSPEKIPYELEREEKVYRFRVVGVSRAFQICFNSALKTDKETEYFSRGCTLIRELLNLVFEKYNVLFVKNIKYYDKLEVNFSQYTDETYQLDNAEDDLNSESAEGKFRYRVGFWVTVKDQIDKRVTNKVFSFDTPVEFKNDAVQYRSDMDFRVEKENDGEEPVYYEIENIPDGAKEAVAALSEHLQREEEKEKIFQNFLREENSALKRYITSREQHAHTMADGGDPVFRYNVLPLTIYLDRMNYKRYTYSLTHESGARAAFSFRFDPTKAIGSIECPNPKCKATIAPGGENKLVLAYARGGNGRRPVVACKQCSVDLGSTGYYSSNDLNVYLKEDVLSEVDHEGKKIDLYRDDAFQNELDHRFYSKKSGCEVQYYFLHGELKGSETGKLFPRSQIRSCPNCKRSYAVMEEDKRVFEQKCVIIPEDERMEACVKCVGVSREATDSFKPNEVVFQSNVTATGGAKELFFCRVSNGEICASCGRILYRTQAGRCILCGGINCNSGDCINHSVCKNCRATVNEETGCLMSTKEGTSVWARVKSLVPLSDRCRVTSRKIFKREEKNGMTLYYVVLRKSQGQREHVYCFEENVKDGEQRAIYILLNQSGKYATL